MAEIPQTIWVTHTSDKLVVVQGPLGTRHIPDAPLHLSHIAYIEASRGTDISFAAIRLNDPSAPLMALSPSPKGLPSMLGYIFNRYRDVVIDFEDRTQHYSGFMSTEYGRATPGGHRWDEDQGALGSFLIGSAHPSSVWRVRGMRTDHSGRLVFTLFQERQVEPTETFSAVTEIAMPRLKISSITVERALSDAAVLIRSNGHVSGLDRLHTAFHGYLKAVCQKAQLTFPDDSNITTLFKLIQKEHPSMSSTIPGQPEMERIQRAIATIIDALNPIRNRGSIAHANDELLNEPEAILVVNSIQALLDYLNRKIQ